MYAVVFSILLLSFNSFAMPLPWNDLEVGTKYSLIQSIPLEDNLFLQKNETYKLVQFTPENHYFEFQFINPDCKTPANSSDLVLYKEIGIVLREQCHVTIYIEPWFYYDASVFTNEPR